MKKLIIATMFLLGGCVCYSQQENAYVSVLKEMTNLHVNLYFDLDLVDSLIKDYGVQDTGDVLTIPCFLRGKPYYSQAFLASLFYKNIKKFGIYDVLRSPYFYEDGIAMWFVSNLNPRVLLLIVVYPYSEEENSCLVSSSIIIEKT